MNGPDPAPGNAGSGTPHGTGPEPERSAAADSALARLLRELSRDVAHELRGPVQSVVVNLEVLRSRARKGQIADVQSRADILEQEVRRLHALADAFIGLLRESPAEPAIMPAETLLAVTDPLVDVIARARHVTLERQDPPPGTLVRVRAQPAGLAIVRLVLALCEEAGTQATLVMESDTSPDAFTVRLELRIAADAAGAGAAARVRERAIGALPSADAWLREAGGTATLDAGSDSGPVRVLVRVPRAT